MAIGSTCENWASEIRFRQLERADATPLGRRLERCRVSRGSHGRPEPSARSHARALKVPPPVSLPRDETLYTSGTATSPPSNFNPLDLSGAYTGTQGLLYEPLFLYDPVHGRFIPWLATSGAWDGPTTYKLQVRGNVDWTASPSGAVTGSPERGRCRVHRQAGTGGQGRSLQRRCGQRDQRDGGGQHRHGPVPGARRVRAVARFPLAFAGATRGHVVGPGAGGPVHWGQQSPRLDGTDAARSTSSTEACYRDNPHWWGKEPARAVVQVRVPLRHSQWFERSGPVGIAREPYRLEQRVARGRHEPGWRQDA